MRLGRPPPTVAVHDWEDVRAPSHGKVHVVVEPGRVRIETRRATLLARAVGVGVGLAGAAALAWWAHDLRLWHPLAFAIPFALVALASLLPEGRVLVEASPEGLRKLEDWPFHRHDERFPRAVEVRLGTHRHEGARGRPYATWIAAARLPDGRFVGILSAARPEEARGVAVAAAEALGVPLVDASAADAPPAPGNL